jgi:hypothetical protein
MPRTPWLQQCSPKNSHGVFRANLSLYRGEFNSPFSRNRRNHLARMFVLHDVVYNGRITQNPIVAQLEGVNTAMPQPVDRLNSPNLIFCADVDASTQDGDPLPTELSPQQQQ